MQNFNNILTEQGGGILTVTLNRPEKLNALNFETLGELDQVIDEVYKNESIKAVILTGSGEKAFVAGADINEIAALKAEDGADAAKRGQKIFKKMEDSPKPILAAVNGFALGGGCELAMACHIRIASENAQFAQPEINLGIIPGYGGTQRLTQYIGKAKALELMMTGDMISAKEALVLGLVNYVVSQDELLIKAGELLEKITKKAPLGIGKIIEAVNNFYEPCNDGYNVEARLFGECTETEDFKEGTQAFLEKRQAKFRGK